MWNRLAAFSSPRWATPNQGNAPNDWLDNRYFYFTVAAAALLHLAALFGWYLMPHMQVVSIPVRALDIKLGNGDLTPAPARPTANTHTEHTLSQTAPHEEKVKPAPHKTEASIKTKPLPEKKTAPALSHSRAKVVGKFDVRAEKSAVAAPVMPVVAHQFVRELGAPAKGNAPGSNETRPSTPLQYEQALSLWLQKFKVYPEAAREANIQGDAVVRIRIDRQGNIGYYILEHSTGSPVLDRAAIDMIKRANPVPPVPAGYPGGDLLEFMIPVNFHLQ